MRKLDLIVFYMLVAVGCGCSHSGETSSTDIDDDIVAQYRDTVLRMADVRRSLPPGITPADSTDLTQSIIDQWIDGFLIEDLAASQIDDMDRINQLTENYRRSLIAESYRRKMRATGVQPVDEKRVREYYRAHRQQLKLERPVIKGLFIKVPSTSRYLSDIRRWMKEAGANAFDELENIGEKETATFRYFAERWVDLDVITGEIPYRFGDADKFVESTVDFETEHNGMTYILHVDDYRHSGEQMPEDYATPIIEDRIKNNYLADYEKGLIKALRQTAQEKKILTIGNYTR